MSVVLIQDSFFLGDSGEVYTTSPAGTWYNGSALYASKASAEMSGNLHATFQGTSISFVGVSPPSSDSTSFIVAMDSNANYTATYPSYAVGDQTIADYVLITAGSHTNLTGQTIFVDDSNEEITWSGDWWTANDYNVPTGAYDIAPAGNGSHTSTSMGDSFTFLFAGTTINVYGIMSWGSSGTIGALFSVDGYSTSLTFTAANTTSSNGLTNSTNYPLFSNTTLSSGNHTLTVNVTTVSGNLPFIIDYLTYHPNFDNVNSKPQFTGQTGTGSGSSSSGSSSGSGPATSSSSASSTKTHIGAIAGGAVGGVLAIAAVLIAILVYRRRRNRLDQPRYSEALRKTDVLLDSSSSDKLISPPMMEHNVMYPMRHIHRAPGSDYESSSGYASTSGHPSSTADVSKMTIAEKQAELRRRMDEISGLMQQVETQTSASGSGKAIPVDELQARIEQLTKENERLMSTYVLPPAYELEGEDGTESSDIASRSEELTSVSGGRQTLVREEKRVL
ncbi:hypothetical protein BDP27DRAFT_395826 [Rhodocollybia butyracea]|uniref:Uncharacterized protein n=1 Tax=Rhodocollybia butyracea TaxID=206335 RepID=A0A9P5UBW5_9AGAR|nr:hypothetical protein BDP27DRAFT_395826 [Rhodocollybia butyracea]